VIALGAASPFRTVRVGTKGRRKPESVVAVEDLEYRGEASEYREAREQSAARHERHAALLARHGAHRAAALEQRLAADDYEAAETGQRDERRLVGAGQLAADKAD
jgi:hypothetical protein